MNDQNQNFKYSHLRNKNLFSVLTVVLIIFLLSLIVSTSVGIQNKIKEGRYIGKEIEVRNTITVSDAGEIYAKPDLAIIDFSVATEGKTVSETMNQNTERMNKVINFIKEQGVETKDLKTINFNISPRYEYRKVEIEIYPYPPGKRMLVGYEVIQTLEVKIRDLDKIGKIIEGATTAGANQVGDLYFTIDKQDELKKQARAQAIEKAKNKAKELASQLGLKLVRITNFNESSAMPRFYEYALKTAEAVPTPAPQIETGENKISVTVNITYEIN